MAVVRDVAELWHHPHDGQEGGRGDEDGQVPAKVRIGGEAPGAPSPKSPAMSPSETERLRPGKLSSRKFSPNNESTNSTAPTPATMRPISVNPRDVPDGVGVAGIAVGRGLPVSRCLAIVRTGVVPRRPLALAGRSPVPTRRRAPAAAQPSPPC